MVTYQGICKTPPKIHLRMLILRITWITPLHLRKKAHQEPGLLNWWAFAIGKPSKNALLSMKHWLVYWRDPYFMVEMKYSPIWVVSHGFLRFPGPNQYNHPPPGTRHFSNKKTHTNSLRAKKFIVEIDFVDFWCKTSKKSKVNILKGKRLNPGRWVDWIAGSSGFHSCASLRISRRTLRLKKGRHKCDKMAWNNQLQAK